MAEAWRLVTTWGGDPGWNMALDEALLLAPGDGGEGPPVTVRVYTWAPDTLSLGYFQRLADVPPAAAFLGQPAPAGTPVPGAVVRRLTGGGAIHHARELTFSLSAPADHPLYRGPVAASYGRVHAALAEALAELGARAEVRADKVPASEAAGTGMCFHVSSPVDLVWQDRKGVGSAQRRTGGRVLHHGSIKLGPTALDTDVASLPLEDPRELAPLVLGALARRAGATLEPGEPTDAERAAAEARAPHFTSEAFLRRR